MNEFYINKYVVNRCNKRKQMKKRATWHKYERLVKKERALVR